MKLFTFGQNKHSDEKREDYKRLLMVQFLIVFLNFTIPGVLQALNVPEATHVHQTVLLSLFTFYIYRMWDMLRNFTDNPRILRFSISILILSFSLVWIVVPPYRDFELSPINMAILGINTTVMMLAQGLILYFCILDIFAEKQEVTYRLWGATSIYMMIGFVYTYVYGFFGVIAFDPAFIVEKTPAKLFSDALQHSFYVMAGRDYSNEEYESKLMHHIGAFQALVTQLYGIILVGRLLAK